MTDQPRKGAPCKGEPDRKDAEEKQRLAEALRANLRRRKDQARGKRAGIRSGDEKG